MIAFRRPQFIAVTSFAMSFGLSSASILVPLMAKERLGATESLLGAYGLAFNLIYIFLGLWAGALLSKIGFRASVALAGLALVGTSLWSILVQNRYAVFGPCLVWGMASGLFWPAVEAAGSEKQSPEQIKRGLSWFSFSWVTGAMVGLFVNGWLYEIHLAIPFAVSASLGVAITAMALRPKLFEMAPWNAPRPHNDEDVPAERRRLFVSLAFLANFALWVGVSCFRNLLPEYAHASGLTGLRYGLLFSAMMGGFLVGNAVLTHWHGWHYSARVLVGGQLAAAASLLWFSLSDRYAAFICAQLIYGAAMGLTYFSSIYYGMELGGSNKGHGGRHEAVIAAACGFGPLIGGLIIAVSGWDRAAFPSVGGFILAAVVVQIALLRRAVVK